MKYLCFSVVLLLCTPGPAGADDAVAEAFGARVFRVFSGDSFMVRTRGRTRRIRLAGVRAPAKGQPHAGWSRQLLEKMIGSRRVEIRILGPEEAGVYPARVTWEGHPIAREMVRAGGAWVWPRGDQARSDLRELERRARAAGRGLWGDQGLPPPWNW